MPVGTAIKSERVLVAWFQATGGLVEIRASLRLFVRAVDTREGERDELLRDLQAPFELARQLGRLDNGRAVDRSGNRLRRLGNRRESARSPST